MNKMIRISIYIIGSSILVANLFVINLIIWCVAIEGEVIVYEPNKFIVWTEVVMAAACTICSLIILKMAMEQLKEVTV